jgi:intein/homing endonuclease
VDLAEFVGIVLGDGGMTRGQLSITLNSKDDLEYSQFVIHLCKKLFRVNPSVYIRKDQNALVIMISRVALIRFLTQELGLVVGNKVKHQVAIPDWIMTKKVHQIACLRGLVDTDGSVFTHRYTVKGKQYTYKKLSYTSASTPLKYGARNIFKTLGMQPRLAGAYDVRLDSKADMKTYFTVVSSHNPKHLKRLKN